MAEWGAVNISSIDSNHGRIDAEFFRPGYLQIDRAISSLDYKKLGMLVKKIDVGHVGSMVSQYCKSGVKLLQTQQVREFFLDMSNCVEIKKEFHNKLKKSQVRKGDVLIARSGSFGVASIYLEDEVINSADIIILEIDRSAIDPLYLVAFLNSKYGSLQLRRFASGGVQGHVNLKILGDLKVPLLPREVQRNISTSIADAYTLKKSANSYYQKAQTLLESELGLDKLTFDKPVSYAARFSEVSLSQAIAANRIDAQCFSPSAMQYEQVLSNLPTVQPLRYLTVAMVKGAQQDESTYGTVPYVSIKHIQNSEVLTDRKSKAFRGMPLARKGDVLLALTGSIGKVGIVSRYDELTFSGDVLSITAKNIDSYYLVAVLSDRIGQVQLMRWITGSNQGHLAPRDVGRVLIPRLDEKVEARIASLMKESIGKTYESARLLDQAKRRVEKLIEEAIAA